MPTHTITLDAEAEHLVEAAARAEQKPVTLWLVQQIRRQAEQVLARVERAETARRSGYAEDWIAQFILQPASVEDDDPTFVAPLRSLPRPIQSLDAE